MGSSEFIRGRHLEGTIALGLDPAIQAKSRQTGLSGGTRVQHLSPKPGTPRNIIRLARCFRSRLGSKSIMSYGTVSIFSQVLAIAWVIFIIVAVFVHLAMAFGILRDGQKILAGGNSTKFVSPMSWSCAVLVTSVFGVLVYWFVHHSTLSEGTENVPTDRFDD